MGPLREKLRHAFAVEPPGPTEPAPEEQAAVDWVCRQLVRRRLTSPGLFGLELVRPLNFVASQFMHVLAPSVWALSPHAVYHHYRHFAAFLERRGSIEYLARRLEELEAELEPPPADDERDHDENRS